MNIKEYKINREHIEGLDKIVETADKWFEALDKITMHNINYNSELYDVYYNYVVSLNEHMSTFLDVMKTSYDKLDLYKDIFKNVDGLYEKINISLYNIEQVFDTYFYMLDWLQKLKEEYIKEYSNYQARYICLSYNEDSMKQKFDYVCPFHYDLITKMNEFATNVAEPQLAVADAIYAYEMDFNQALGLENFGEKNKV